MLPPPVLPLRLILQPPVSLNLDIADISTKATSSWKLALSWNTPSTVGAGIATYKVFRSTNGTDFTDIASTAGTSYVDSNLNQQLYYYDVQACDSADNCGALTGIVSMFPLASSPARPTYWTDQPFQSVPGLQPLAG